MHKSEESLRWLTIPLILLPRDERRTGGRFHNQILERLRISPLTPPNGDLGANEGLCKTIVI